MASDPRIPRLPPMPTYDPRTDGNPFAWIVAQAPIVRAERHAAAVQVRTIRRVMLGSRTNA